MQVRILPWLLNTIQIRFTKDIKTVNKMKMNRNEMIAWIEEQLPADVMVRTSELFDGRQGGIWMSGESGAEYNGREIYNYWAEDYQYRTLGVLDEWEEELNTRGWYSEWYDAGTIGIWKI